MAQTTSSSSTVHAPTSSASRSTLVNAREYTLWYRGVPAFLRPPLPPSFPGPRRPSPAALCLLGPRPLPLLEYDPSSPLRIRRQHTQRQRCGVFRLAVSPHDSTMAPKVFYVFPWDSATATCPSGWWVLFFEGLMSSHRPVHSGELRRSISALM